MTIFNNFQ